MRKVQSLVIILALLFTLLPTLAFADDGRQTAQDYAELIALLSNPAVHTIVIEDDIEVPDGHVPLSIARNITIEGGGHTIDGCGNVRLWETELNSNASTLISDLTFENFDSHNYAPTKNDGGALYLRYEARLINCHFNNNSAGQAGAIFHATSGTLTLTDCSFTNNTAQNGNGGAISTLYNASMTNCVFTNNTAAWNGGAAYVCDNALFDNCVFIGNTTGGNGGAICVDNFSTQNEIRDCAFTNNAANQMGGSIYSYKNLTYTGANTFKNNNPAGEEGHGIAFYLNKGFNPGSTGELIILEDPELTPIKGEVTHEGGKELYKLQEGNVTVYGSFKASAKLKVKYQHDASIQIPGRIITGVELSASGFTEIERVALYVGIPYHGQIVTVYLDGEPIAEALVIDGYLSFKTDRLGAFIIGS